MSLVRRGESRREKWEAEGATGGPRRDRKKEEGGVTRGKSIEEERSRGLKRAECGSQKGEDCKNQCREEGRKVRRGPGAGRKRHAVAEGPGAMPGSCLTARIQAGREGRAARAKHPRPSLLPPRTRGRPGTLATGNELHARRHEPHITTRRPAGGDKRERKGPA